MNGVTRHLAGHPAGIRCSRAPGHPNRSGLKIPPSLNPATTERAVQHVSSNSSIKHLKRPG
jgi:hypothetical protein